MYIFFLFIGFLRWGARYPTLRRMIEGSRTGTLWRSPSQDHRTVPVNLNPRVLVLCVAQKRKWAPPSPWGTTSISLLSYSRSLAAAAAAAAVRWRLYRGQLQVNPTGGLLGGACRLRLHARQQPLELRRYTDIFQMWDSNATPLTV